MQVSYDDSIPPVFHPPHLVRATDGFAFPAPSPRLESLIVSDFTAAPSMESDATYRKVALHLIPILILCYFSAYIDRSNIGIAKLQFTADLHIDEAMYGLGGGLFYLGYSLFEVPSMLVLRRVGARRTFFRILLLWSLFSAALAGIKTPGAFYALRFLIGVAEAGFFPGVLFYLSHWVPAARRARFTGWFLSSIPLTGIIGGPLSGFLLRSLGGFWGLKGWQWLFIVEGLPGVLLAVLLLRYLCDSPTSAHWLSERQKTLIARDLAAESSGIRLRTTGREMTLMRALRDPPFYALALMSSAVIAGAAGIALWMPTILRNAGFATAESVAALTAIPYAAAFLAQQWVAHRSDRRLERRWHAALSGLVGAAGWAGALFAASPAWTLLSLSIAAAGTFAATGPFWSLPAAYLAGRGAAAGIAVITTCGGLASFLSPLIVGSAASHWHTGLAAPAYYSLLLASGSIVLLWGTRPRPA
jgi:MFS family permease